MATFRVRMYQDMQCEEPDREAVVSARDHTGAAARMLREAGYGWADWIRVEQQDAHHSVVCFLDSRWVVGVGFVYEASYRR